MKLRQLLALLLASVGTFVTAQSLSADDLAKAPRVLNVWPGKPPGETKELPPEADINQTTDSPVGGRPIIKLANVSTPTLSIYRPEPDKDTGTAVIICPGGGHNILAFDHEGTEVAEWLNTLGVTGIVLKYRVPARDPQQRWMGGVQDAQRSVSLVRSQAQEWSVRADRVGILGFSAGGEVAGRTALMFAARQYPASDDVDQVSSRPDFAILIYPAYLVDKDDTKLRGDVPVSKASPPMFLAHAFDDPVTVHSSLALATELKKSGVSAELHVFATGGHGYGIRNTNEPVNTWPARCGEWLARTGWLKK